MCVGSGSCDGSFHRRKSEKFSKCLFSGFIFFFLINLWHTASLL